MNWQPLQYGQPPAQPNNAQPQGAPGPYVPPGASPVGPPPQQWSAPSPIPGYGMPATPGTVQGGPQGYGAPGGPQQGYAAPAPQYPPQGAPPGYGAPPQYGPPPGAAPGYGAPPQGYGPQLGGPVSFAPAVLSLDNMSDPDLPAGSHIVVGTGAGGSAAQGKMFRVELRVEKSNNPQAVGQIGNFKVWLERKGLQGGATAHAQAASKDAAMFAVPASGRQLKDCDLVTANNLVGELLNRMTIEGRPLQAIRLGCDVTMKPKKNKPTEFYANVVFHVLPPGV